MKHRWAAGSLPPCCRDVPAALWRGVSASLRADVLSRRRPANGRASDKPYRGCWRLVSAIRSIYTSGSKSKQIAWLRPPQSPRCGSGVLKRRGGRARGGVGWRGREERECCCYVRVGLRYSPLPHHSSTHSTHPHSLHQSHIHPGNATTSLLPPILLSHVQALARSLPPCVATDGSQQHALEHTNARTRIQAFRKPRVGLRNTSTGRSGFASVPRLVNTLEVRLKVTPGESDVIGITFVNNDIISDHE